MKSALTNLPLNRRGLRLRITSGAWILFFVLLAGWYVAASLGSAIAYAIGFTLIGVGMVSGVYGVHNASGIELEVLPVTPVHAGATIEIPLIASARGHLRHSVFFHLAGTPSFSFLPSIAPERPAVVRLEIPTAVRGRFTLAEITVASFYPLGFFRVSLRCPAAIEYWVYPAAKGEARLPRGGMHGRGEHAGLGGSGSDFIGTKVYQLGESERHVDWRAVARGHAKMTKLFGAEVDQVIALEWAATAGLDVEARVSQLARWIEVAEAQGRLYSLHLPGESFELSRGESHFHACMRALAELHE